MPPTPRARTLALSAYYTILLPIRIEPYSDGWHWAKRRGMGGRHAGVRSEEELTDEEVDHDDEDAEREEQHRPARPGLGPVEGLGHGRRS